VLLRLLRVSSFYSEHSLSDRYGLHGKLPSPVGWRPARVCVAPRTTQKITPGLYLPAASRVFRRHLSLFDLGGRPG
jgi:hypothetical protein